MPNPWTVRLERFAALPEADKLLLDQLVARPVRFDAHRDVIGEGDVPPGVHVVREGFACRYKLLSNGRRQITGYLLPGDLCHPQIFLLKKMDHNIATLSPSKVAIVPREAMLDIIAGRPQLTNALWWSTLQLEAIQRAWITMLGARSAWQRLAHLFCELQLRLEVIGATFDGAYDLPLTQADLADTVGLSHVHINRSLQRLRRAGLIALDARRLRISDPEGLAAIADFSPDYLHLYP